MTALKRVFSTKKSKQQNAEAISEIYNAYTFDSNNNSVDTLSSKEHLTSPISDVPKMKERQSIPQVHILSRLSSLQLDEDKNLTKSAPQTPTSGGSFDFQLRPGHIVTNSSLNVLLDSPNNLAEFRRIVESQSDVNLGENATDKENEDWNERGAAIRKIDGSDAKYKVVKRTVKDFTFGKHIGEGSYSTVVLATDKHNKKQYAVKVLDKRHIIKEKKVKYVNIEKHALNRLSGSKGIISLYFTFQDKDSLYFVLDYASNGELLSLIKKYNTLNEDCVRLFGAQILDAIKFMHDNGVIHRDIKPENILLDDEMRIKITDFGTARLLERKDDESEEYPLDVRAKSFVGTAEYVSPELLDSKYCGKPGDIWAFGCILYQMIAGKPPFKAANEYLTFQKITKLQFAFSAGFPLILRDLIKKILVLQPSRRATIPQIQKHAFFESIDFENSDQIWNSKLPELGPYKMTAKSMMKMPEKANVSRSATPPVYKTTKKVVQDKKKKLNPPVVDPNVNPASVAAYVLNKTDNPPPTVDTTPNPHNGQQKHASNAEYIPGTNILRPNINKLGSYVRTVPKKKVSAKVKPRVMEVSTFGPLEDTWVEYLTHPDERILKTGMVTASKMPTDILEKKYKLKEWNYPVSGSLLSKVVNASSSFSSSTNDEGSYNDEDVFIEYNEETEGDDESSTADDNSESNNSNGKLHSSIFKKFLKSHDKKEKETTSEDNNAPDREVTRSSPLELQRVCTLVVTTHGRALILVKNKLTYKLITEIKLNYSQVQIKEILHSNNKFQNLFPTSGLFAIIYADTSIIFEVDKQFLALWTEVLARSKFNQGEREKLMHEESMKKSIEKSVSPTLESSPVFTPSKQAVGEHKRVPSNTSYTDAVPFTNTSRVPSDHKHQHTMMHGKLKKLSTKRKAPTPIRTNFDSGVSGIGSGNEGILHAAQLAVNGTSLSSPIQKKSSFTKDSPKGPNPYVSQTNTNPNHKPAITSMNSKFLARSQRKK